MSYCAGCGTENAAADRYCQGCGAPARSSAAAIPSGSSNPVAVISIILVVILALIWAYAGLVQVKLAFDAGFSNANVVAGVGAWNLLMAALTAGLASRIVRRQKSVVADVQLLGILNLAWGIFGFLWLDVWLYAVTVPLYLVLWVLTQSNRGLYNVQVPKKAKHVPPPATPWPANKPKFPPARVEMRAIDVPPMPADQPPSTASPE